MNRTLVFLFALFLLPVFQVSAAEPACTVPTMDLTEGSKGPDVSVLQTYLERAGHLASGNVSGTFTATTRTAVQAFQRKEGLNAQGFVGPLTRARMLALCPKELAFVGIDVPRDLRRETPATWTLQLSPRSIAPNSLTYDIDWGDDEITTSPVISMAGPGDTTLLYFMHTYERKGSYTPTFTITAPDGKDVRIQATARVKSR